ncbi:MAG: hypothetical protein M3R36_02165 [Bacteroidota bacterium]|nr:hypothetical protein [Bacteroidota bacterium]
MNQNRLKINLYTSFLVLFMFALVHKSPADNLNLSPNPNSLTKVYLSIVVNNISEVNAAGEFMKADIYVMAKWKDPRLAHDDSGDVIKNFDNIWAPMITISNRLSINKSFSDDLTVGKDGTVTFFQRLFGEFTQNFQFREFPFDTQTFEIKVIAIGPTANDVELVPDPEIKSGISNNFALPDWKILDWKYDGTPHTIIEGTPQLPALTLSFRAKRESGFYILVFVIPLVLIIVMSWMAFWLDPKLSSSQISIATTSMLTLIAYRFVVSGSLPKISYMTRMDIFVLGSSILIFVTLIESVITASMSSTGKEALANKIDKNCRWIFPLLYILVVLVAFVF